MCHTAQTVLDVELLRSSCRVGSRNALEGGAKIQRFSNQWAPLESTGSNCLSLEPAECTSLAWLRVRIGATRSADMFHFATPQMEAAAGDQRQR